MWSVDLSARLAGFMAILMSAPLTMAGEIESTDCMAAATTQQDTNQCAASQLTAADDEMDRLYRAILDQYKDDQGFLSKLQAAQQAWLAFRNAELEARFPAPDKQSEYGSVYPMCSSLFLVRRTRERIAQLREWLDGVEEGEVCAGSVRYRAAD